MEMGKNTVDCRPSTRGTADWGSKDFFSEKLLKFSKVVKIFTFSCNACNKASFFSTFIGRDGAEVKRVMKVGGRVSQAAMRGRTSIFWSSAAESLKSVFASRSDCVACSEGYGSFLDEPAR